MNYAEVLYQLTSLPIVPNEWIGRDVAYTWGNHVVMHPLMWVQLRANGDFDAWLKGSEAWVVARADRQAAAALRRLDDMVEAMNRG